MPSGHEEKKHLFLAFWLVDFKVEPFPCFSLFCYFFSKKKWATSWRRESTGCNREKNQKKQPRHPPPPPTRSRSARASLSESGNAAPRFLHEGLGALAPQLRQQGALLSACGGWRRLSSVDGARGPGENAAGGGGGGWQGQVGFEGDAGLFGEVCLRRLCVFVAFCLFFSFFGGKGGLWSNALDQLQWSQGNLPGYRLE